MSQVTEAYSIKQLGEKIIAKAKADGLTIAEEAAEKLAKAAYLGTKEWAQESAMISENKIDDAISLGYNFFDPLVIPQIEKLDLDGDGK